MDKKLKYEDLIITSETIRYLIDECLDKLHGLTDISNPDILNERLAEQEKAEQLLFTQKIILQKRLEFLTKNK